MPDDIKEMPADRLTFGFKLVCSMVGAVAAICLFIVNLALSARQELSDLRYDMRDQKTRQEAQIKIDDDRNRTLTDSINRLDRLLNVEAYEIATLKYSMSQAGIKIRYPPSTPKEDR